jgi:hypothetical protein
MTHDDEGQARALLDKLIVYLALKPEDPERWPNLEKVLAAAIWAAKAEAWEEAADYWWKQRTLFEDIGDDMASGLIKDICNWCRAQAEQGRGEG